MPEIWLDGHSEDYKNRILFMGFINRTSAP